MAWKFIVSNESDANFTLSEISELTKFICFPLINFAGVITNIVNIVIFSHKCMKDVSFKYLLVSSLSDCMYTLFASAYFVSFCESFWINFQLEMKIYELLFIHYITSVLAVYCTSIDIVLAIYRYLILTNSSRTTLKLDYKYMLFILLIISCLFYSPVLISSDFQIQYQIYNNVIYETYKLVDSFPKWTEIELSLTMVRLFVDTIVLSVLNVIIAMKYSKRYNTKIYVDSKSKSSITMTTISLKESTLIKCNFTELKANRSITLMVTVSSVVNSIGLLPYSIEKILEFATSKPQSFLRMFGYGFLMLTHGTNMFVYFKFNKLFRKIFYMYMNRFKLCFSKSRAQFSR